MSFSEILNYNLIKTENFSLTVFHMTEVILILAMTIFIQWLFKRIFKRQERRGKIEIGRSHTIFQIIKYILWISVIIFIFDTVGVNITAILVSSAALLVGLGLGLQKIFQDFVSGIALLLEGTLKAGDIVEIENGEIGKVLEIGLRTSKMETRDNIIMIIPNSKLINENVINWSHIEKKTRFHVKVGVAYGSDVELVEQVLLDCVKEHKLVAAKPEPFVRFKDFGESSLDFELFFWTIHTFIVENIKSDLRFHINKAFHEKNIHIPFPQRDVYIKKI